MAKGGYKLIDLHGINIAVSGDAVKVEGVHQAIESSNGKPAVLCGISIGGIEKPNCWVNFYTSGTNYAAVIGKSSEGAEMVITITDSDMVSVA